MARVVRFYPRSEPGMTRTPRAVVRTRSAARRDWPTLVWIAVRIMARRSQPGERGVGDTVARLLGVAGETFKVWFHAVFGRSCGCAGRQAWLNRQFPYNGQGTLLHAPGRVFSGGQGENTVSESKRLKTNARAQAQPA